MGNSPQNDRADRADLRRLARGDADALDALYRRHATPSWRHALWVTRSAADADDVVQTVFVRLAGGGAELLGIRNLRSYLGAMVHREALRVVRRRARMASELPRDPDALLAVATSPEVAAEGRLLARHLAALPDSQREVLVLRAHVGLSFREIGRAQGVSTFTAAGRWRLALRRLRRAMGVKV